MEAQRGVVFSVGPESEVRYNAGGPDGGDRVSPGNPLWIVSEVGVNGVGTYVTRKRPRDPPGVRGARTTLEDQT